MSKLNLNEQMSKLSLDSEKEDNLTFYLTSLRRRGKCSYLFSKTALFIPDLEGSCWIYLELRKIKDKFTWGCSVCEDLKTFRNLKENSQIIDEYCIHAQVAFMLINDGELLTKYNEKNENIEVVSEDPYYAIAHVGKVPSVIHFPLRTKAANCSQHPGSHKARKHKCEHLVAHFDKFQEEEANHEIAGGVRNTRAKAKAQDGIENLKLKTKVKPTVKDHANQEEKRECNPYNIKIDFIPGKSDREKYRNSKSSFPENLIPNPDNKYCECGNQFCSKKSALERYLIMSDKVHIHDILPVDDSRNTVCRVFYLDTALPGTDRLLCQCRLPYRGEEDQLLPISTLGKDFSWTGRKTYNLVSYRLLFDFFLLEMSDGCSETGFLSAFNRRRRMLCGNTAKECSKTVWCTAVKDFENALTTDEVEAFTCHKCPSESSPGDGQDEVHIGDGVCEGTQVDLVPEHVKKFKESTPSKYHQIHI